MAIASFPLTVWERAKQAADICISLFPPP
jgi:hypothetical protein